MREAAAPQRPQHPKGSYLALGRSLLRDCSLLAPSISVSATKHDRVLRPRVAAAAQRLPRAGRGRRRRGAHRRHRSERDGGLAREDATSERPPGRGGAADGGEARGTEGGAWPEPAHAAAAGWELQDFGSHMEKRGALQLSDWVWHLLPVPGLLPQQDLRVWRRRRLPKLQAIPGAAPAMAAASTSAQSSARARKAGRAQQDRGGSRPRLLPSKAPLPRELQQEQEPSSGFLSGAAQPSAPLFALSLTGARRWRCPSPEQSRRRGM